MESELAEILGVSRQPVREALQWLANEGWVDLKPGYGAFVHAPTHDESCSGDGNVAALGPTSAITC